jgi:hypothetical protein
MYPMIMDYLNAAHPVAMHHSGLWMYCMAVYHGQMDITELVNYMRSELGWWADKARPLVELCQPT